MIERTLTGNPRPRPGRARRRGRVTRREVRRGTPRRERGPGRAALAGWAFVALAATAALAFAAQLRVVP